MNRKGLQPLLSSIPNRGVSFQPRLSNLTHPWAVRSPGPQQTTRQPAWPPPWSCRKPAVALQTPPGGNSSLRDGENVLEHYLNKSSPPSPAAATAQPGGQRHPPLLSLGGGEPRMPASPPALSCPAEPCLHPTPGTQLASPTLRDQACIHTAAPSPTKEPRSPRVEKAWEPRPPGFESPCCHLPACDLE